MSILNKEGKVYRLSEPNPLVKQQEAWDPSGLVFHNFEWDEVKMSATHRIRPPKKAVPVMEEMPVERMPIPSSDTPKSRLDTPSPGPAPKYKAEQTEQEKEYDMPYIKHKVLSYCLPAIIKKGSDKLYGESWKRVQYGNKMIFPSVIIEASDFSLSFWTSDPNEQIGERSIIYPFAYEIHNQQTDAYDRVPYDEYRWWKVTGKEQKEGGWLFSTIPSEVQPDFSD
jgi:hypothetical protein